MTDKSAIAVAIAATTSTLALTLLAVALAARSTDTASALQYQRSPVNPPTETFSAVGPPTISVVRPTPTIAHYCRISPRGVRVCCLGREPTFETWRVRYPGLVRTYWRLFCA